MFFQSLKCLAEHSAVYVPIMNIPTYQDDPSAPGVMGTSSARYSTQNPPVVDTENFLGPFAVLSLTPTHSEWNCSQSHPSAKLRPLLEHTWTNYRGPRYTSLHPNAGTEVSARLLVNLDTSLQRETGGVGQKETDDDSLLLSLPSTTKGS
ncbi:hypothetical protein BDV59DRAFT_42575 [Aspergillus ambiguus]|uniref:uncharacterized protein n=1 Tax=Aspergillus ambiguus TaxID=176160 RepID=UPI003CCCD801